MQRRGDRILKFWDRSQKLSVKNKDYREFANRLLNILLNNDIKNGDLTTNCLIKNDKNISAFIVAKEEGIVAGLDEFKLLNHDLRLEFLKNDGDKIKKGDVLIKMNGNAGSILEKERTSLNLLQRMSGIATMTNALNKKLKNKIKLAATRKTLWGSLDKKAISLGGGLTHRLNLSDGILIKDNHLKMLNNNLKKAVNSAKNKSKYIEIEVESKRQALIAAESINKLNNNSLFAIMLDKIPSKEIRTIIGYLKKQNLYQKILFEASGNINPNNLTEYKDCEVDIVSMGCLTNSARILNMSLEIE